MSSANEDAQAPAKSCPRCGAGMEAQQDWCVKCGAAAEQRVPGRPGWRSAAAAISASAVLALGAAAAAYAALNEKPKSPPATTQTVAQAPTTPPATPTTPSTPTTPATPTTPTTPTTPATPEAPAGETPSLPEVPEAPQGLSATEEQEEQEAFKEIEEEEQRSREESKGAGGEQGEGKEPSEGGGGGGEGGGGEEETKEEGEEAEEGQSKQKQTPMLLDTNSAHVYNPYSYPEATFTDPSLAIDGESTTAFVVKVREVSAPKMADGLLIDMKALTKVEKLTLITNTPGFTLQVYGTKQKKQPPETITSKGWVKLTKSHVAKKKKSTVELNKAKQQFRQILVWLVKAPEGSTPEAPGHVAIDELQLFEKSG